MEQIEAPTLADEIAKAPIPVPDLLRRAIAIASAVNQFHREGRVHGHIEPSSFVLTATGVELAEPSPEPRPLNPYTAPEQLHGNSDARGDIFAAGAVLYELATGWKAFAGHTQDELRAAIAEKQ